MEVLRCDLMQRVCVDSVVGSADDLMVVATRWGGDAVVDSIDR